MTRNERRYSGSSSRAPRARIGRLLLAALVVCLAPARAQEVEDLTATIEKYRGIVAVATQRLEDLELPEALAGFTEVVDAFKAGRLSTTTPLTRQIVGQAYEGRARTFANLGRTAEAEADYEALLKFDLTWPVDRTRISPKIIALYDGVRHRLVGTLGVSTEPPGARLSLDGEPLGRSPLIGKELLAGSYTIKVEADGFEPLSEPIVVSGGAGVEKSLRLVPNARDVVLTTSPAGATIKVDDAERGVTSGQAGQDYSGAAAEMGLALADISAPLVLEHLPPGNHKIRIEKTCHEPQLLSVDVAVDPVDNAPVRFAPVRLAPSKGSLSIESTPAAAEVVLDGVVSGSTPAVIDQACSGSHELLLRRKDVGQWRGRVEVAKGERAVVKATLRPTLAYVGLTAAGAGGAAPAGEEDLGDLLQKIQSMNVLGPSAGLPDALMARRRKDPAAALSNADISAIATASGADLVLSASPAEGAFERKLVVEIVSTRYLIKDQLDLSLEDDGQKSSFLSRLDAKTSLSAPWVGLSVIERRQTTHPTVIRVRTASPALAAGVKVGDRVVSLAGVEVHDARDLSAAIAKLPQPGQASLVLKSPTDVARTLNITVGSTILIPNPSAPGRLSSRLAVELASRAAMESALGKPASPERSAALLGLASLLLEEGQPAPALKDALELVTLPPGPGISEGTVSLLKGMAQRASGQAEEGRRSLEQAAGQKEATIGSNDGPLVSERAQRLLSAASLPK